jgi:hypothetical protein
MLHANANAKIMSPERVDHRIEQFFALRCGDIHGSMAFIVSSKGRSPTFGKLLTKCIHH